LASDLCGRRRLERAEILSLAVLNMSYTDYYGVDRLALWKPRTKELKVKILKYSRDFLEFEVDGETHTFLNPLRMELLNIDGVVFAAYRIVHPLVDKARFVVRTDPNKIGALEALKVAKENLKKKAITLINNLLEAVKEGETRPEFLTEEEYRKIKARF